MSAWRWLPLVLLVGCVPGRGQRVPEETLARIPFAGRVELLDAEDELALAHQRVAEAARDQEKLQEEIRDAEAHLDTAEAAARRQKSPKLEQLAVDEARARLKYLYARDDAEKRNRKAAELQLQCAEARLELARVKVAQKAKIEGADQLPVEQFEKQVDRCSAQLEERHVELRTQQAQMRAARSDWEARRLALDSAAQGPEVIPFLR
ncbi:MAG: hypothetical protein WBV82_16700 [Myxococcaceae bacterium]